MKWSVACFGGVGWIECSWERLDGSLECDDFFVAVGWIGLLWLGWLLEKKVLRVYSSDGQEDYEE